MHSKTGIREPPVDQRGSYVFPFLYVVNVFEDVSVGGWGPLGICTPEQKGVGQDDL